MHVFTWKTFDLDEFLGATNHPIHIHGHHVHILKVGYPEVDEKTGLIVGDTPDIECAGKDCKYPSWKKEGWAGGNVPDTNLRNPPLKDTVVVPRMGYVVLRFPLDNPGTYLLWTYFFQTVNLTSENQCPSFQWRWFLCLSHQWPEIMGIGSYR